MTIEFREFEKIARLKRNVVVTEKIDGTNACVVISDDGLEIGAQSRSRLITPEDDNCGFAKWVHENRDELMRLGPGHHFGEWWGAGIQRRYGLTEKRFSLFNTGRWSDAATRPACCHVVPVIANGVPTEGFDVVGPALAELKAKGSFAAPGFMNPEGVIVYHCASRMSFKMTIEKDEEYKGKNK